MKRSEKRILTTHVGSIPRPPKLRDVVPKAGEQPSDKKRYEEVLRESVAEVVKLQAQAGIDIVNDGEFGKSSWANYILERTTGFEHRPNDIRPIEWLGRDLQRFADVMATEFPMFKNGIDARAQRAEALVQPWCDFRYNRQRDSPYLRLQIFNRRSTEAVFCIVLCRGTCAEISVTSALLLA